MNKALPITLLIFITACSFAPRQAVTPEEAAYLSRAMATPLIFRLSLDRSDEAWGRIQSFIGRFSSMKLQIATDYVIETYNPAGSSVLFGYSATRTDLPDECEIEVRCMYSNTFTGNDAIQNAHILALYALTGELMPRLIRR